MQDILLSNYSLTELQDAIRSCIQQELNNVKSPQVEDVLLSSREAARFLKVSLVTLHNWKTSGQVKFHRIGSRIRFKRSDLDAALLSISNRPKSKKR